MTDRIPVKAVLSSGNAVGLAEFAAGDTTPVAHGGTGSTTVLGARASLDAIAPAFSVYPSVSQSIANGTFVKLLFQSVEFDATSAYSTTTHRFTPLVSGYYQISGKVGFSTSLTNCTCSIFKNSTEYRRGDMGGLVGSSVSSLVYLNGTTDFVEFFAYQASGAASNTVAAAAETYFNGVLIRVA